MATAFGVTPLFVGEPATAHGFGSPSDVVAALGIVPVAPPVALALAPRVQLIAARTSTAHPALRWVSLSPVAATGGAEIVAVVVCSLALADSPSLLRIAGRLRAALRDARVVMPVALIETPPLARLFGLAPLAPAEWAPLLAFPSVILGLEELRKCLVHARARGAPAKGDRRCTSRTSCRNRS